MPKKFVTHKENYLANISNDLPAGLVVFLVAVPLCLGIALASGAPFFSGIIAGMVGGLIVAIFSGSQLSVSGPAAGLTAVVLSGIEQIGSFEGFLLALVFAGVIQICFGVLRAGFIAYFFPSSVIKGMLAAIGIILILKQVPHAVGYDVESFGLDSFFVNDHENTLTLLVEALTHVEWGAFIISSISLGILMLWQKVSFLKNFKWVPGALVVVVLSIFINQFFGMVAPDLMLNPSHLVSVPQVNNLDDFLNGFASPDWNLFYSSTVWFVALTVGVIASVETLLTIEAVDKLDPYKRKTPLNRELIAQGIGNSISGLIGGLPLTSVIVRSSANINSGGRTKMAAFFHGVFLLVSVVFLSQYLNMIPLAALAAILLTVGYKLAKPSLFKAQYAKGFDQFTPFFITVVVILLTNLLIGISIGIVVGLIFVIRTNFHTPVSIIKNGSLVLLRFNRDVSFLNKALINEALETIEEGSNLLIDGRKAKFIDNDVLELIEEFEKEAELKNISVEFQDFQSARQVKSALHVIRS